jgi:hypothetical protein
VADNATEASARTLDAKSMTHVGKRWLMQVGQESGEFGSMALTFCRIKAK